MRRAFVFSCVLTLATIGTVSAQPQLLVPLGQSQSGGTSGLVPAPAPAAVQPTEAEREALEFRRLRLQGRDLHRAVRRVDRELAWFDELDAAAAAATERGVPIVWIQALGDLGGYT